MRGRGRIGALCVLHFGLCCVISCGLSIRVVRFCIIGFVSCCSCVSIYNRRMFILVLSFCGTSLFLLAVHIFFFLYCLGCRGGLFGFIVVE